MKKLIIGVATWLMTTDALATYSSTAYMMSWTCEQQEFSIFVQDRFFRAINRARMRVSVPAGFPTKRDRNEIAAGLIEGQQKFFPNQPDVKIRLLAFSMCETQGNPIDIPTRWGREIGWTGWNIHVLRGGANFWGIPFPASDSKAIARIKRDHCWAGYLTMAACASFAYDMGGFEHALAVKTFGFRGWCREYNKNPDARLSLKTYPKWLSIAEVAYRWDGKSSISALLYAAMSAAPITPPDPRKL